MRILYHIKQWYNNVLTFDKEKEMEFKNSIFKEVLLQKCHKFNYSRY